MAHPFAPSQTHNKLDLASFNHPTAQSFLLVQRLTDVHPPNVAPSGGQKDHITVSEASPGHVINPLRGGCPTQKYCNTGRTRDDDGLKSNYTIQFQKAD